MLIIPRLELERNLTKLVTIHPENPQLRLVRQVVSVLREGGVIAYPTDSAYALGCHIGDKKALEQIRRIRELGKSHNFTLICRDLSELATYAKVSNSVYRFLKASTPGPYTFILPASKEVPKRLQHPKRKSIGLRIPANSITAAILEELKEPLMSVTLILPEEELPLADPEAIYEKLQDRVCLVIDGGSCGVEPTTVIDLIGTPTIVRHGKGDISLFS